MYKCAHTTHHKHMAHTHTHTQTHTNTHTHTNPPILQPKTRLHSRRINHSTHTYIHTYIIHMYKYATHFLNTHIYTHTNPPILQPETRLHSRRINHSTRAIQRANRARKTGRKLQNRFHGFIIPGRRSRDIVGLPGGSISHCGRARIYIWLNIVGLCLSLCCLCRYHP